MIAPIKILLLDLGLSNPEGVWWDGVEDHCLAVGAGEGAPWRMRWQMRPIATTHAMWLDNRLREWAGTPIRGRFRALALFVYQGNLRPAVACRVVSGLCKLLKKSGELDKLARFAEILAPLVRWVHVDPDWYDENYYWITKTMPGLEATSNLLSYLKEAEDGRSA